MIEDLLLWIIENTQILRAIVGEYREWGNYGIILSIIMIEFLTLTIICLINVFVGIYRDYQTRQQDNQRIFIHDQIHSYLYNSNSLPYPFFSKNRIDLDNIVPLLDQIDTHITSARWTEIKANIALSDLRLKAKKWAKSKSWNKQNLGLRFINFLPLEEDLPLYLESLNVSSPLIQMQAVEGLIKLKSPVGIRRIIELASNDSGYSSFAFIDLMIDTPLELYQEVLNIYQGSSNPVIRLTCLKVLKNKFSFDYLNELEQDLISSHLELVQTAVACLGQLPSPRALGLLNQLADHSEWKIRVQVCLSLGKIADPQSISLLLRLQCDLNYQVRLNACLALLKFGEQGIAALSIIDEDMDNYASQTGKYVLSFDLEAK